MTEQDDLYQGYIRDRRRVILVLSLAFGVALAIIGGTLGVGWALTAVGRDTWATQALTWQDRYIELYDEFTAATGEEPVAPEPGDVAKEGPQGEPGEPGTPGPPGPAGTGATDGQVLRQVVEFCSGGRCVGPPSSEPGAAGTPGEVGAMGPMGPEGPQGTPGESVVGPQGETGATGPQGPSGESIVGPQGPVGPAGPTGPTCPDGYTAQTRWVNVSTEQGSPPAETLAILCLPTTAG